MDDLVVVAVDDPRLLDLVSAQEQEVMSRYGVDDAGPGISKGAVCFMVVVDGQPAGCAALSPLQPGFGEIKRMYVAPAHRGRGLSKRLLKAVEGQAVSQALAKLRLETGIAQPEAVALYRGAGYLQIECYGHFAADPTTLCFEKDLGGPPD